MIETVDGIYAQAALTPVIGFMRTSGTFWHLKDGCPEVDRLASMGADEAKNAYEAFRVEANSGAISSGDARKLEVLFSAALRKAEKAAPRREVALADPRVPGSWLLRGYSGPKGVEGVIGVPTPAVRALRAMSNACNSITNGWWNAVRSTGSTGGDWFDERG